MRNRVRSILFSDRSEFFKISSWSAVSNIIKILTGFVSIKLVAVIVGPSGIALLGQYLNWITMMVTIGTGFITSGVVKHLSELKSNFDEQKIFIATSGFIVLFCSIAVTVGIILSANFWNHYVFGDSDYIAYIYWFAPFVYLCSLFQIILSILNGSGHYQKYFIVAFISSFVSLVITVILTYTWKLEGALLNAFLTQVVMLFAALLLIYKERWFGVLFNRKYFSIGAVKKYSRFTLMAAVTAIIYPLVQIEVRNMIIDRFSIHDAGIWEAVNRFSGIYLMFITTTIGIYYLPKISGILDKQLLRIEIVKTMKIILPGLILMSLVIFLLREWVIRIVYSNEFAGAESLIAVQLIGDFFKVASWLLGYVLIAKALVTSYIVAELFYFACFLLLAKLGIQHYGVIGVVYAHVVTYVVFFFLQLFIFSRYLKSKTEAPVVNT